MRIKALVAAAVTSGLMLSAVGFAPTASAETLEEGVIRVINQYRASGVTCVNEPGSPVRPAVGPLTYHAKVSQAAQNHANYLTTNDAWGHTESAPDPGFTGVDVGKRLDYTGYIWAFAGENVAGVATTPDAVVQAWLNSHDGHCSNMMNGVFVDAGVGYSYKAGTAYGHYWALNMGKQEPSQTLSPGVVDASVSMDNLNWVLPSTVDAPTSAAWWVKVNPPSGAIGTYRVEVFNNSTSTWDTAKSGLTSVGVVQMPALTAAQVNAGKQAKVRTFVYGPSGAAGVNTASPATTFQFKAPAKSTTMTLSPQAGTINTGSPFTVSGTITSGVPVGSSVTLKCEQSGGSWGMCFNGARVTSDGVWTSWDMTAPGSASLVLRADFDGVTGSWAPSSSAPVTFTFSSQNVSSTITGPASAAAGSVPTIVGTTSGIPNGYTIDLEKQVNGEWQLYDNVTVTNNTFAYPLDFAVTSATTWRVVYQAGTPQERASAPFTIQIATDGGGGATGGGATTGGTTTGGTTAGGATTGTAIGGTTSGGTTTGDTAASTPAANESPQIPVTIKRSTATGWLAKKQVRKVKLQRLTSTGTWKTVKTKKTSFTSGKVKFYRLKKRTQYRLYAPQKALNGVTLPATPSRTFTR